MNGIDGEDGEPGPPGPPGPAGAAGAGLNSHYVITLADASLPNAIIRPQDANYLADTPAASPNTMDDEFNDTTGNSGAINGLNARWTNTNTAVLAYTTAGWAKLTGGAHTGHQLRGILQTLPGDGTYDCKISCQTNNDTTGWGIWLKDGLNGDSYFFNILAASGTPSTWSLRVDKYSTDTGTVLTNLRTTGVSALALVMSTLYLRFVKSGTTFSWWHSMDGIGWTLFHTETDSVTPTLIGIGQDEQGNTTAPAVFIDWFRKTA